MEMTVVAAALPYRRINGNYEILLIRSSAGRWILPKGHSEPEETPFETAKREAWEEAGVRGEVAALPYAEFNHIGADKAQHVLVFPLLVHESSANWPEKSWREQIWTPPSSLPQEINPDLERIIADFVDECCG
jgi:8-oxo-dGTP pyrophosphatase MutT (NUDIX family)